MTSRCASLLVLTALVLAACGDETAAGDMREWRASDHSHPSADTTEGGPGDPATGAGTAMPPEDASPEETEIRAAAALFRAMCGTCHGEAGRGDGPGRPPAAQMADLSADAWQSSRSDEEIAEVITAGRGGFMPAFGDRLSPPGIAALTRHVRRLGGRATVPAAVPEAEAEAEAEAETEAGPAPAGAP